jgi:glycosyltransferase involved in cell wall biosynthesis
MKVIQVVTSISAEASGPSYSVPALSSALARQAVDVELHVLHTGPTRSPPEVRLIEYPITPGMRWVGRSRQMMRGLLSSAKSASIVHTHGMWLMPNIYAAWAATRAGTILVTSPRGVFSPAALRHSRWRKRLFWAALQRRAARQSDCFHATAAVEVDDIRRVGLAGPIALVPNGIDVDEAIVDAKPTGGRQLLFLGRLHPKKGVDILLRAWSIVEASFPEWGLYIVGPDDGGYGRQMERLAAELSLQRVKFEGAIYGAEKVARYRAADLFVLPTRGENFGLAVAEALANGIPAIVSTAAPWGALEDRQCGWSFALGVEQLADCIRHALSHSREDLAQRGARGRQWMKMEYSWQRAATMMRATYEWLLGGGSPPPWVDR